MSKHRTSKRRRSPIEDKLFWVIDDWGGAADLGELVTWAASDKYLPGKITPAGSEVPQLVAEALVRMKRADLVRFEDMPEGGKLVETLRALADNVKWIDEEKRYLVKDNSMRSVYVHLTRIAYESYGPG